MPWRRSHAEVWWLWTCMDARVDDAWKERRAVHTQPQLVPSPCHTNEEAATNQGMLSNVVNIQYEKWEGESLLVQGPPTVVGLSIAQSPYACCTVLQHTQQNVPWYCMNKYSSFQRLLKTLQLLKQGGSLLQKFWCEPSPQGWIIHSLIFHRGCS